MVYDPAFPNTEDSAENTMHEVVLLTNYEVLGNEVKHSLECLKYLLKKDS